MKFPPATVALAFLLGVACIAVFDTLLSYQASNCSDQQQAQRTSAPSHGDPSAANKPDDGSHDKKQKSVSEPFACGVKGFPTAVRQFMNHNEGFVVGGFTFLLVFVTGWLVYVTGGLRESTEKLWLAGERQIEVARIAANAADLSARAAIGLQLPIFRVNPAILGHGQSIVNDVKREDCWVHFVEISNHGNSRAFPSEFHYGVIVGNYRLPKLPIYTDTVFFQVNATYEPDSEVVYRVFLPEGAGELRDDQWSEICQGKLGVTFYCLLIYLDFMDTRREVGFCWRWENVGMGMAWVPDETPAYNRKT